MRYQMKQRLLAFGDDYTIINEAGTPVFWLDGKAVRVRQRLAFNDMAGIEQAYVRERMVAIRETYYIYRNEAVAVAITPQATSSMRDQFTLRMVDETTPDEPRLIARGNVLNYEYIFRRDDQQVAAVSKQWFSSAGTYGVDIQPAQDDILILVGTAVIDVMARSI